MNLFDRISSPLSLAVLFPVIALSTNLATAEEATQNELSLIFGWEANIVADVETRRGKVRRHFLPDAKADEVVVRYVLTTSETSDGIRVSHSQIEPVSFSEDERESIRSALQFAGIVTDYSVSNDGQFQGIEDASSTSQRVERMVANALSSGAVPDGVVELVQRLSTPDALTEAVEARWEHLVGFWSGQQLEVEAAYGAEGQASHPLISGIPVPINLEFGISGWVPCTEDDNALVCVEMVALYEYDLDAMRSGAIRVAEQMGDPAEHAKVLAVTFTEYSEEIRVVADPATLQPFRYEYRKTIDGVSEASGRDGRVEYVISDFNYR
jgi:hypothetical protein